MLQIVSLDVLPIDNVTLTMRCLTQISPPREVVWKMENLTILSNETHWMSQALLNATTATYATTIQLQGSPLDLAGRYTCMAKNSRNEVATQAVNISGM